MLDWVYFSVTIILSFCINVTQELRTHMNVTTLSSIIGILCVKGMIIQIEDQT